MKRSNYCGALRSSDIGREVVLQGWVSRVRDLGGLSFLDLRDREGLVQVVLPPEAPEVKNEYVVQITGVVRARPEGMTNAKIASGEIEVAASALVVLSEAKTPPFPIDPSWRGEDDPTERTSEELRIAYRYLDLRRQPMLERMRLRHRVSKLIWDFLDSQGFIQVETPLLTRSTPEGARDYLVPSRLEPGHFYALPQSPQLFKQMLMVAGFDRYFQIARCFRDEDLRRDRQPDFTQLDLEMSFVEVDDVLGLNERLLAQIFNLIGVDIPLPLPRISYREALDRFGSDRPDPRLGLEFREVTEWFKGGSFALFANADCVKVLPVPKALSRREIEDLEAIGKRAGLGGLAWSRIEEGGVSGGISRHIPPELLNQLELVPGTTLLFGAGEWRSVCLGLGAVRNRLAEVLELEPTGFHAWWVVDFPLFEPTEEGGLTYSHNPFVAPHEEDLALLESDPFAVRGLAYDLVLNGSEIAGGSLRNHRVNYQLAVLGILGIGEEAAWEQFGFLLGALGSGAPPHGGIAWGLDRLLAILSQAESIREVIAFPKNQSGRDPLTGAPAQVSTAQLEELSLAVKK